MERDRSSVCVIEKEGVISAFSLYISKWSCGMKVTRRVEIR